MPLGLLAIAGLSAYENIEPLGWIAGVLGIFLTIQATRVKYVAVSKSPVVQNGYGAS